MNRYRAFALHLLISASIMGAFLGVMILFWYPDFYFKADGGMRVLKILVLVDVVLGPVLTLIIFKPNKPGLRLDLSIIALIQISALIYGGQIIYKSRPALVVFVVDRYNIISRSDIDVEKIKYPEIKQSMQNAIIPVYAKLPDKSGDKLEISIRTAFGGFDVEGYPEYYEPYAMHIKDVLRRGHSADKYLNRDQETRAGIEKYFANRKTKPTDYLFYPMVGKNKDLLLAVDKKTGAIDGAIDVNPWLK